jgi:predicted aspartyl protease
MVDTGAQYSVLNKPTGPLSQKISLVQGATGSKAYQWTSKCQVDLGRHQVTHSFLVIPECPAPLLGRDLLTKVRAHIHFEPDGIKVTDGQGQPLQVLTMSLEDEHRLFSLQDPPLKPIEWSPEMAYWIQTYPQAWAEIAVWGWRNIEPR